MLGKTLDLMIAIGMLPQQYSFLKSKVGLTCYQDAPEELGWRQATRDEKAMKGQAAASVGGH